MSAITEKSTRTMTALMLALLMAGQLEAESPWDRLTSAISGKVSPAQPINRATEVQQGATAIQQSDAQATPPVQLGEVPVEGAAVPNGTQVAALSSPDGGFSELNKQPVTGLAIAGKGKDSLIDLGNESDEDPNAFATNLFKNPEMLRLLGDQPRFVYDPQDRPDPMLVPWVRNAAIYKELSVKAEEMVTAGRIDEAVALFTRILEMKDQRFTMAVQARLTELGSVQQAQLAAIQPNEIKVELPGWVQDNTTGVIVSPGSELVLVGDYMVKVGDPLPNYPEIKVAAIASDRVTYQIQNKSFEVELKHEE